MRGSFQNSFSQESEMEMKFYHSDLSLFWNVRLKPVGPCQLCFQYHSKKNKQRNHNDITTTNILIDSLSWIAP